MQEAGLAENDDDQPRSMRDAGVRERRRAMLDDPHMIDLTRFAKELRLRRPEWKVPDFDPLDGGVKAQALFFLETPGPEAVKSGFVSSNNPDPTAENMGKAWKQAGLKRCHVLLWNVVPHCVSTIDKNRNATAAEVREAVPETQTFIDKLWESRKLKVIVFCGLKAQRAIKFLQLPPGVAKRCTFHTAARAYNHPRCCEDIHETFREVSRLLDKCLAV
jgi:uracil-DNA glycosylase